jgi:putative sugar O-methyltransferase
MYSRYIEYLKTLKTADAFKHHPNYTYVLEHVSPTLGNEYLTLLQTECGLSINQIVEFCQRNDRIGNPIKSLLIGLPVPVSPTSLRYLYHAWLILQHMKDIDTYVEIGGGYGGLCLALDYLNAPINTYYLIDIDEAISLQKLYLEANPVRFQVVFHSASTYGSAIDTHQYGLISNYCFSEIESQHQIRYMQTVFPNATRGFLVWNHVPLFDLGKHVRVEPERPITGPGNLFVRFGSHLAIRDFHSKTKED